MRKRLVLVLLAALVMVAGGAAAAISSRNNITIRSVTFEEVALPDMDLDREAVANLIPATTATLVIVCTEEDQVCFAPVPFWEAAKWIRDYQDAGVFLVLEGTPQYTAMAPHFMWDVNFITCAGGWCG